jgi:hypothetical protein
MYVKHIYTIIILYVWIEVLLLQECLPQKLQKQLINGPNDKGRLGKIQYILAMYRGSQNTTRISPHDYLKLIPIQNGRRGPS